MTPRKLSRRELGSLALAGFGGLGLGLLLRERTPAGTDVSDRLDVADMLDAPGFPAEGPARAAVRLLVFSDYACAVCRRTEPEWQAAVAHAGDVRVVHRDWPILGPASVRAARVALAASYQGRYEAFRETLMRTGRHDETAMRRALMEAGGDWARLDSDLARNGAEIDRRLARTAQDALQLGFRGTPGYLIGPIRIEGGTSRSRFAQAIRAARAWQAKRSETGAPMRSRLPPESRIQGNDRGRVQTS